MADSETDAAELELSSEDDHAHSHATNRASLATLSPLLTSKEDEADDVDDEPTSSTAEALQAAVDDEGDEADEAAKAKAPRASLDDGVSYASYLWDNPRVVVEQAEDSRLQLKKMVTHLPPLPLPPLPLCCLCPCGSRLMCRCVVRCVAVQVTFFKDKAELDRYYAKTLKKLVDKATVDEKPHLPPPVRSQPTSTSTSTSSPSAAAASAASSSSSSSFDLVLSSFRHLSLTLSANFDLLAAKEEEQLLRPLTSLQSSHSASTRRIADDLSRLQRQLTSLTDTLSSSKAASKKACQDLQLWLLEHRERQLQRQQSLSDAAAPDVDLHSVFDDLVQSFRWDADGMKKRTLGVDARYIAAVKALRSYRPQHDALVRQLMAEAQSAEEERRKGQLAAVQTYCEVQAAMFDKYCRSVRAVGAMQGQVNLRREMRGWVREHRGEGRVEPLPEYVMHKGHPRYEETEEEEEQHDHEGITEDEDDDAASDDDGDEEDGEGEEEEDDDEEEEEESSQARKRRQRRRRQRGADELDEREDEKSEERIVAEKVLRVFVNKTVGNRRAPPLGPPLDPDLPDLQSPPLTAPLPRSAFLPVSASDLSDGAPVDADEEAAARAIFSTRDGRNAFAAIFSSLSPTFHGQRLPLSLFSAFDDPPSTPPRTLALPPASFAALTSLTCLFLDASAQSSHVEPAVFVANVARQLVTSHPPPPPTSLPPLPLPPPTTPSAAAADDVMRREEVEGGEGAEGVSLLRHLSSHPLLADLRFFSTAVFSSLHHHLAHRQLHLHRWHSDAEQEAVVARRKELTFRLIGQYSRLMQECGVKRRERRRFVEKQLRLFDLTGAEWKEEAERLRELNERPVDGDEEGEGEEEEDEGSPLNIDGLREAGSDSEEEKKAALLRKKEEERALMAANKAEERRRKRRVRSTDEPDTPQREEAAAAAAAARRRKAEEEKEAERRRSAAAAAAAAAEEAKKKAKATPSFFASSLSSMFRRTPSPTPAVPPPTAAVHAPKAEGGKMTIPIPVASAVPPLAPTASPVLTKAKEAKAMTPVAAVTPAGEVKKRPVKRVVRKKRASGSVPPPMVGGAGGKSEEEEKQSRLQPVEEKSVAAGATTGSSSGSATTTTKATSTASISSSSAPANDDPDDMP